MSSRSYQVAQDAMDFGQKGHANACHGDCPTLCTYTRTISAKTDLHALLKAAVRINYHVIALHETKSRNGREAVE
ncbi:unnamed protein product [Strongylus vulgaris]|uniref:Uncharacterized protein n=1 Tax=Strongylus vulgaris TaxID=40348 RepID=A0A3P7IW61_STRVU|nr:unnamed protein product [Strongylus vulgaris]